MTLLRLIRLLYGSTGLTADDIARTLGIPVASVRRLVGELRSYGIGVRQSHGFYTFTPHGANVSTLGVHAGKR